MINRIDFFNVLFKIIAVIATPQASGNRFIRNDSSALWLGFK